MLARVQVQLTQGFRYTLGDDVVWATVYARRPDATTADRQPRPAFVERIELCFSFAAEDAVESIKFDALQAIADSPQFSKLILEYTNDSENEYKVLKTILHSVLNRKQLMWALESRKLQFRGPRKGEIVTSSDILLVLTEYIDGDITITLDTAQRAELLLRFTPDAREEYLQTLVTARMSEGSSSHADPGKYVLIILLELSVLSHLPSLTCSPVAGLGCDFSFAVRSICTSRRSFSR